MPVYKIESTKDKRCWVFRCYKDNQQYKSKKYATKREAEEAERLYMIDSYKTKNYNFHLVSLKYFEEMKTYNRLSTYQSYYYNYNKCIEPFFGKFMINKITTIDIKHWHEFMDSKNYSIAYKNKTNSLLSAIFNYGIKYYDLKYNPVHEFGTFKEVDKIKQDPIKCITYNDFQKFLSVIPEDTVYYVLFYTMFITGCRKSELYGLQWESIDFSNKCIDIHQTLARSLENGFTINPTKNNQNRKILMNNNLCDILLKYKQQQEQLEDFNNKWFVFGNELPISRTTVDRYKDKYIKESGCPYFTCHMLRHTAVTILVNKMLEQNNGTSVDKILFSLSTRFGHTPNVMIRTYAHLWEEKLQEPVIDILDNL